MEKLLEDLDNLDESLGSAASPSRNRESLKQAREMDTLTGTLDDLLLLTEAGIDNEPKQTRGPLSRRSLKVSKDVEDDARSRGTVESSAGDFISPRPPLMPKRQTPPSNTSKNIEEDMSTTSGTSPELSAHGSSTNSMNSMRDKERVISADVESELENLLGNSQVRGPSEPSSPIKNSSGSSWSSSKSPMKSNNNSGHESNTNSNQISSNNSITLNVPELNMVNNPSIPLLPGLDVNDFDDSPRCAMVGASMNRVAIIPLPFGSAATVATSGSSAPTEESNPNPNPRGSSGGGDELSGCGVTAEGGVIFTPYAIPGLILAANKKKCIRVTIHGTSAKRGCKESSFNRDICCGNLRCIKCNFSVVTFPSARWTSTVDYMFFRNANCDAVKLSSKLERTTAAATATAVEGEGEGGMGMECAYCCQCSWATSDGMKEREMKEVGLQWVCSGHVVEE